MKKEGYDDSLIHYYQKQHWLESAGRGAFKLHGDETDWYGGVYALQKQLGLHIHVGAKTSLTLQGYAHYVLVTGHLPRCHLFGIRDEHLPAWFRNGGWNTKIIYTPTKLFEKRCPETFLDYNHREFTIRISCAERAAMEMCYLVPKLHGFDETEKIMENLMALRPDVVQELLIHCHFIKVKRLFLYFADKLEHPWFRDLDLSNIDLGAGERQIIKGGVLDKKYRITVPRSNEYENFNI